MATRIHSIDEAVDRYNPIATLLMFSGGHDSLVSSHYSAKYMSERGMDFKVYHGDTTIGIQETQEFVKDVCKKYKWDLVIRRPVEKDNYENIVRKFGFPGPTKTAHQITYRLLKQRALRKYVTHECKTTPYARENVLLITGIRKNESIRRMGYSKYINKIDSRVWVSPILRWTKDEVDQYISNHDIPRNPVKDKLCISGECLCGAYSSHEELMEIKTSYPDTYNKIMDLHKIAKENGHPWPWSQGPSEWYKNHPPGAQDMFMCFDCEQKRNSK